MTNPQRYINRVLLFLVLAAIVVGAIHEIVWRAFMHNPALNGLIMGVLLLGILYAVRRILQLKPEVRWIEAFQTSGAGFAVESPPKLLAPVAGALGERERRGRASLSALSMRYLLDSISARLDESRDITRYQTGLLIFLGLLGTFWGLLETISSVSLVISDLSVGGGDDMVGMFDELKAGLAAPLSGMGTAFSSSLFGLAGSLVLGFIDLQASQAQNNFYNEMEEWLSGLTRLSGHDFGFGHDNDDGPIPTLHLQAMMQQTAENLENLRETVIRSEETRGQLNNVLYNLSERLGELNHRLQREHEARSRGGEGTPHGADPGVAEATMEHMRNIDMKLTRLVDDLAFGREESVRELRNEIKLVSRTIAIAAGEPQSIRG
ncbi:MAG: flagellar motor protein MotA [Geminicoccaceae bacterium]|nr:flagellar motor protein MotA [Geminicoccaceae bacterium]